MADIPTLRSAAWVCAARCLQVDQCTAEVVTTFRHLGIRSILLKGPVVARWLYAEDPGLRSYVDADLLVAPTDLAPAGDALRALGFVASEPLRPRHAIRKHADEWYRASDGVAVDLHVALHGTERVADGRVWEAVAANTERWDVAGAEVEVPGVVARTLHAVLNFLPDDPPSSQAGQDLTRAIDQVDAPTWSAAAQLADHLGVGAETGAKLARIPAGAALAGRLGLPAHELEHNFPIRKNASVPVLSLWHFGTLPSARTKARYLLDVFIPPPSFLRARWSMARRGRGGLAASYLAWVFHSFGRGAWAFLRYPSLRRQWREELRAADAVRSSAPPNEDLPRQVSRLK